MNVSVHAVVFGVFFACSLYAGDLERGKPAPDFTLSYATKDTIVNNGFTLSSHIGKNVIILAFYPADWSGGCTKEMCTIRDEFSDLTTLGANVYGISGDYVYAHREWARQLNLPFMLLSDHQHEVARLYQSYNEQTGFNRRTVFVIDKQGLIAYMDLHYSAATPDSFNKLKAALTLLQ
jgi:peroxiredoxin